VRACAAHVVVAHALRSALTSSPRWGESCRARGSAFLSSGWLLRKTRLTESTAQRCTLFPPTTPSADTPALFSAELRLGVGCTSERGSRPCHGRTLQCGLSRRTSPAAASSDAATGSGAHGHQEMPAAFSVIPRRLLAGACGNPMCATPQPHRHRAPLGFRRLPVHRIWGSAAGACGTPLAPERAPFVPISAAAIHPSVKPPLHTHTRPCHAANPSLGWRALTPPPSG
jgi:hypothetical protein